jgi:DNA-binding response OmpR family regulator
MSDKLIEEGKGQVRILIVDDDAGIADILRDLVSREGRFVHVCYDGLKALAELQAKPYDLLILDLFIPGVEGLEVFKYAKQVNSEVLVIIITGFATLETAIAAIKEGAYDYIQKPFKLDGFKNAIDNAVEKVKLNKENRELLGKLRSAYKELTELKQQKAPAGKIATINFLSSSMPSLHYLYDEKGDETSILEKLNALVALREKGLLSDREFRAMKGHLLKTTGEEGWRETSPWKKD